MTEETPIYSHNPYDATKFPLLVLNVERQVCRPFNEGFRVFHWHDEVQFVYILKGIVHFRIYDEEEDLKSGDCMFINRGALHQIMEKEDCQYHSYIVPVRMFSFFSGSIMEERDVKKMVAHPLLTHYALRAGDVRCQSILEAVRGLEKLYFEGRSDWRDLDKAGTDNHLEYRISIQLAKIWLELLDFFDIYGWAPEGKNDLISKSKNGLTPERKNGRAAENQTGYPGHGKLRNHERIRRMLSFIHENYAGDISLKDIAGAASISPTECQRCFRTYVRCSPYQYLMKYRLESSARRLTDSKDTITEIAMNVGFHSVSAYIKYFKKYYGTTPVKYRRGAPLLTERPMND